MPPKRIAVGGRKLPSSNLSTDSENYQECFTMEEEILWCIKKLESSLLSESITPKSLKSTVLALKTLKNSKAPVVKKRQVMRMSCGDYRKGMLDELNKAKMDCRKLSLLPLNDTKRGSVLHTKKIQEANVYYKSETDAPSDSKFCFNFPIPDDEELRLDFQQLYIGVENVS